MLVVRCGGCSVTSVDVVAATCLGRVDWWLRDGVVFEGIGLMGGSGGEGRLSRRLEGENLVPSDVFCLFNVVERRVLVNQSMHLLRQTVVFGDHFVVDSQQMMVWWCGSVGELIEGYVIRGLASEMVE